MEGSPEFRDIATVILHLLGTLYDARNLFAVNTWWRNAVIGHWALSMRRKFSTFCNRTVYPDDVKLAHKMAFYAPDAVLVSFGIIWNHAEHISSLVSLSSWPWTTWYHCCGLLLRARYHAFYDKDKPTKIVYPPCVRVECGDNVWRQLMAWRDSVLKDHEPPAELHTLYGKLSRLRYPQ